LTIFWIYTALTVLLVLSYAYIITGVLQNWRALPMWIPPNDFAPKAGISLIIPARNEARHITSCLRSIVKQNYPQEFLEIIVIDDHSRDDTAALVANVQAEFPQIKLLKLADVVSNQPLNSYKKKAIEIGVATAKNELIVTTDADCLAPPHWLRLIASLYEQKQAKLIAAPVNFHRESNLLERFQSLDYAGMMVLTGAGIHGRTMRLSNGANMAYPKALFAELEGFDGNDHLASGDDMFFAQKVAAHYPDGVHFLKHPGATVFTEAKPTWRSFLQQRTRWATKSSAYREWQVTLVLALVFLFCSNILLSLLLAPFVGIAMLWIFILQLAIKSFFDFQLLQTACRFFKREDLLRSFFPAEILHTFYIIVIGILGNVVKEYEWKGRRVQ